MYAIRSYYAQLPGLPEVAKLILDKQVRLGKPQRVSGLADSTAGPAFATASGVLLYVAEHLHEMPEDDAINFMNLPLHLNDRFMRKIILWLKDNW